MSDTSSLARAQKIKQAIKQKQRENQMREAVRNAKRLYDERKAQENAPMRPVDKSSLRMDGLGDVIDNGAGIVEGVTTLATGALAEGLAGLYGISNIPRSAIKGRDVAEDLSANVDQIKNILTYQPQTEEGRAMLATFGQALQPILKPVADYAKKAGATTTSITGSPVAGALIQALPEYGMEIAGAGVGRRAGNQAVNQANKMLEQDTRSVAIQRGQESRPVEFEAGVDNERVSVGGDPQDQYKKITDTIQNGTPEDIAKLIDSDPNFYKAAELLGINVEPIASYASKNPQFVSLSGSLQVLPGSAIDAKAIKFIEATNKAADEIITKYGGSIDKADLDTRYLNDAKGTISDLYETTDKIYSELAIRMDKKSRFDAPTTREFVENEIANLGGIEGASPQVEQIYKMLNNVDDNGNPLPPTLGFIDKKRKEVGQAISKSSGPFKDEETGLLKKLYATLTDDIDKIAEASGGDTKELLDAGKASVRQRKQIEDNLQVLYGKKLNNSMTFNVSGAIKRLERGEVTKFQELVSAIPKDQRGAVVLTSLQDIISGKGYGQQSLSPTQFTKWMQTLNRSPKAKKALYEALPKESIQSLEALFEVSRGISRSTQKKIPTGISLATLFSQGSFAKKLIRSAASRVAAGTVGDAANMVVGELLENKTDGARLANELLASDEFVAVMRKIARETDVNPSQRLLDLEAQLQKTRKFKKWADTQPENMMAKGAFITHMITQETDEDSQNRSPQQQAMQK